MEHSFRIKECSLIGTSYSSLKSGESYSILRGINGISYSESITSPTISLSVSFVDTEGLVSQKGITGGEYLKLRIEFGPDTRLQPLIIDPGTHKLLLNGVNDVGTDSGKQTAKLDFLSTEIFINETARLNKRFSGSIKETVEALLKTEGRGIKTTKNCNIEDTLNKYVFVGNQRRAMDTIQWLCSKSQKDQTKFGYLFFENIDGYHFKSIDTLFTQQQSFELSKIEIANSQKIDKILDELVVMNNDIFSNLEKGVYSNFTTFINMKEGTRRTEKFSIDQLNISSNSPKAPLGLNQYPSRQFFRILDVGAMQPGGSQQDMKAVKQTDLAIAQSKSLARNKLAFAQQLKVSVPCNTNLRAGQIVNIRLPEPNSQTKGKSFGSGDKDVGGRYLIGRLRHDFGGNRSNTQLTLIRDTFTA